MSRSPETLVDLALARGTVDRAGALRKDPGLLHRLLADPATSVLELADGTAPTKPVQPAPGREALVRLCLRPPAPGDADRLALFLGTDLTGTAYVAVVGEGEAEPGDGLDRRSLREVGVSLSARDAGLFTTAQALANWHATHTHCPRCGSPTVPAEAGWTRRCAADGSEHYPRTDGAVIMSVLDRDDRLLLARAPQWPQRRVSVLAGFVEPGEPLEAAVAREVREEVGIEVADVRYLGNQPWPFPASLMLGFSARALDVELKPDLEEIAEAQWWSRAELAGAVADGSILLSPRLSIARRLIEHWFGGPLGGSDDSAWTRR